MVDGRAPDARDLGHVGRAALAALDLDRRHAGLDQLRQDGQRVQAGRLLDGVVALAVDLEAALAQRRVAARLVAGVAVDQHAAEARLDAGGGLVPAHVRRRRAHAGRVRRLPGDVGRQRAAPLDHHAQAAEAEDLDLGLRVRGDVLHLRQRQHARQHRAADAVALAVELDRLPGGGRGLHRQVQPQPGVMLARIGHHGHVGDDQHVGAERGGAVDRLPPGRGVARVGEGVHRHQHLAPARMGIADALAHLRVVEVQAGEVARVGGVLQAQVDGVGAGVHGHLQRAQRAGRADELRQAASGEERWAPVCPGRWFMEESAGETGFAA